MYTVKECFFNSLFPCIQGANILVDNKGRIKLADFGASKQVVEMVLTVFPLHFLFSCVPLILSNGNICVAYVN